MTTASRGISLLEEYPMESEDKTIHDLPSRGRYTFNDSKDTHKGKLSLCVRNTHIRGRYILHGYLKRFSQCHLV
jgi:hypothetical protein